MYGLEKRVQTNLRGRIETPQMTSKPELVPYSGSSMAATCLLAMRCPGVEGLTLFWAFRTELENLVGDGKGNGTIGRTERPKVPMRQSRGGLLRSSEEAE